MINMCAQLTVHILVNRIINIWLANSVNQYIYILATYNLPIWIVNIQCSFIPWCVIFPSSHKAMWIRNPWLRKMLMCQLVSAQNVVKYPGFEKYNIHNHIYSLIYTIFSYKYTYLRVSCPLFSCQRYNSMYYIRMKSYMFYFWMLLDLIEFLKGKLSVYLVKRLASNKTVDGKDR